MTTPDPRAEYRTQSAASDPGPYARWIADLPPEPSALAERVPGLLMHCLDARLRGIEVPAGSRRDVELRTVAAIVERLRARDPRRATELREPAARLFGVCAHFALVATSVLRAHGVPARTRTGFARYFVAGSLEDHVVTEYWTGDRWALLDAQLDAGARRTLGIGFAAFDVPRGGFLDASTVWRGIRRGEIDPGRVGLTVVGLTGAWFAAQSVLRDAAGLARDEVLPWDTWSRGREVSPMAREVPASFAGGLDAVAPRLAGSPDAATVEAVRHEHAWLRPEPSIFTLAFPTGWPNGVPTELVR